MQELVKGAPGAQDNYQVDTVDSLIANAMFNSYEIDEGGDRNSNVKQPRVLKQKKQKHSKNSKIQKGTKETKTGISEYDGCKI